MDEIDDVPATQPDVALSTRPESHKDLPVSETTIPNTDSNARESIAGAECSVTESQRMNLARKSLALIDFDNDSFDTSRSSNGAPSLSEPPERCLLDDTVTSPILDSEATPKKRASKSPKTPKSRKRGRPVRSDSTPKATTPTPSKQTCITDHFVVRLSPIKVLSDPAVRSTEGTTVNDEGLAVEFVEDMGKPMGPLRLRADDLNHLLKTAGSASESNSPPAPTVFQPEDKKLDSDAQEVMDHLLDGAVQLSSASDGQAVHCPLYESVSPAHEPEQGVQIMSLCLEELSDTVSCFYVTFSCSGYHYVLIWC